MDSLTTTTSPNTRKRVDLLRMFITLTIVLEAVQFLPYLIGVVFQPDILGLALLDRFVFATGIFGLLASTLGFLLEQRNEERNYRLFQICFTLSLAMALLATLVNI